MNLMKDMKSVGGLYYPVPTNFRHLCKNLHIRLEINYIFLKYLIRLVKLKILCTMGQDHKLACVVRCT
jgi:hypothetical protein